jgi:hypothetical protein
VGESLVCFRVGCALGEGGEGGREATYGLQLDDRADHARTEVLLLARRNEAVGDGRHGVQAIPAADQVLLWRSSAFTVDRSRVDAGSEV